MYYCLMGNTLIRKQSQPVKVNTFKKYGWKPDRPDIRDVKFSAKRKALVQSELSDLIDLRDQCPSVYNQGELGSCTANAIGAAYEFDEIKQDEDNIFIPSRLFIYYNERNMENTTDSDSGASIRDGIKTINKFGVCSEKSWPYDISKFTLKPTDECYREATNHISVRYHRLEQTLYDMKSCLNDGFPFVFGFTVFESFESEKVAETGEMSMPDTNEASLGGHAVMAVGYDDSKQQFIIRNSWGSDWGDKGYFYMPYEYIINENLCDDFWTIRKVLDVN